MKSVPARSVGGRLGAPAGRGRRRTWGRRARVPDVLSVLVTGVSWSLVRRTPGRDGGVSVGMRDAPAGSTLPAQMITSRTADRTPTAREGHRVATNKARV